MKINALVWTSEYQGTHSETRAVAIDVRPDMTVCELMLNAHKVMTAVRSSYSQPMCDRVELRIVVEAEAAKEPKQ